MSRKFLIVSITLFVASGLYAQDYFDDLKGNGNPISINITKTFNVSARINAGDNSAKANIFKTFHLGYNEGTVAGNKITWTDKSLKGVNLTDPNDKITEDFSHSAQAVVPKSTFRLFDFGVGSSVKGKTKDGLGSLFSKGQFSGESQFGFYGVFQKVLVKEDIHKHTFIISPFVNFNYAAFRVLADTSVSFKKLDTTIRTTNWGISSFRLGYINEKSQIILGASVTKSKLNNYDDLDKVEMKESVTRIDSLNHTITTVEDKGYIYALGNVIQYKNTNLRAYATWIPYLLQYRFGLVLYPSIDFNKQYKDPLYNLGVGFHFLEKGNPTISTLGLFFEMNDIDNAKDKKDSFIKRSFKVGVTAALNITTLIKKDK